jgi:hypothetical protein
MKTSFHPIAASAWLLRWQLTVSAAFAGGSLTAALLNLATLIALSLVRSALALPDTAACTGMPHV